MASYVDTKLPVITQESFEKTSIQMDDYCSDCLYQWCSKRSQVTYCTMKSKGLFECKSCLLKLSERYE